MELLSLELSLEQEFSLRKYREQVKDLSQDAAQECLLEAFRQLMIKDNVIKSLFKSNMRLE